MHEFELVVTSDDWKRAVRILEDVGIDEKSRTDYRDIDGLFVVSVKKTKPMLESDYKKVKTNSDVAFLSDSLSRKRTQEVLDKIYEVEVQLRKLLLHAYDLVAVFFEVFSKNSSYTKEFTKNKSITRVDSLNPITSHLMLGEMIAILGHDLSWKNKDISAIQLKELLDDSADFDAFKKNIYKETKELRVWDVIAKNVLRTKTDWDELNNGLKILKRFRNDSAHYRVITEKDKKKLIEKADNLLPKITPKRKPNKQEQKNLTFFASSINKSLINSVTAQAEEYLRLLQPEFISSIKFMNTENMNTIKELGRMDLSFMKEYNKIVSNQLKFMLDNKWYSSISESEDEGGKQ